MIFDPKERAASLSPSYNGDNPSTQLLHCVERGLSHYGTTTTQVVFWNFESKFGLAKEDISKYPEKFVLSIEGMFAEGAPLVEKTIIKEMKASITNCDLDDSCLATALKQARAFYQRDRAD